MFGDQKSNEYWQYWLIGKSFTVYLDHKPLENLNIKSRTDEELGNLTYYLSQYEFKIKYAQEKINLEADCLSRNPVLESDENTDKQLKVMKLIKLEDILTDQNKNEELQNNNSKLIEKHNIFFKKVIEKEKLMLSKKSVVQ